MRPDAVVAGLAGNAATGAIAARRGTHRPTTASVTRKTFVARRRYRSISFRALPAKEKSSPDNQLKYCLASSQVPAMVVASPLSGRKEWPRFAHPAF